MVTAKVRQLVRDRAHNMCERCHTAEATNLHHRTPRGMGGSRQAWIDQPANLVLLCGSGTTGCHGWVESHRAWALDQGWLCSRYGDGPELTGLVDVAGRVFHLDNAGHRFELGFVA